jgi:3D (Asp-Asp-Asp) domain-containing protein
MTAIGEKHMKHSTFEKAAKAALCSLLLLSMAAQTDLTMAFGFGTADEDKVVTVYDGKTKKVVTTRSNSFKKVLSESEVNLNAYDKFWTSSSDVKNGAVVVVERAVPVTIVSDGRAKTLYTTQQTVQGVVNEAGFDWKKMMPIEDGMMKVTQGMQIHVVPYTSRVVNRTESIPVHYQKWYDASLQPGQLEVVQEGTPGRREVEMEEYVSDGKVIKAEAGDVKVIAHGTPGIAKSGDVEGTQGYVRSMSASAYHPTDGDGFGITATGTRAGHGTVAVDPRVIPLGSTVYIPNYGEAVAADTGGAIIGDRIDLCMETFEECYNFGRQNVEVFVNY